VFYTDAKYERSIARIAKIKVNENAKRPAFFNCLPEANHNEMIGFSRPLGRFACLYLHDPASHPRVPVRFEAMRTVFGDRRIDHVEFSKWTIPGTSPAEKVFAGITFADWMSYTLALLDGQDPTPVGLVEDFKKVLGDDRAT
jgi:glucose/mannose-6-phosphate isomerase